MNEKVKQPYKDIREHLKDSNFNNIVMEAFELMCGETVEMDLQFDNYPMARTKYLETEASKKSIEFSEKYHGTSVVVKLALEQREELQEFTRIVFEKNVFIWGMAYRKKELKDYEPTYEYYKSHCGYFHSGYTWKLMTEKEFDLVIKVVSKYENK